MSDWLRRLAMWDGMLPLVVWGLPRAAQTLLPAERWPIEVLGVCLPIVAFVARFLAGLAVVRSHERNGLVRAARVVVLFAGLFFLLVIDTAMILRLVMPAGAFLQPGDLIGFAGLYAAYVVAMALATWPGRSTQPPDAAS
ncbi:MAG: hypothetical protein ACKOCW_03335 [Planctomycetaceae bacterium]